MQQERAVGDVQHLDAVDVLDRANDLVEVVRVGAHHGDVAHLRQALDAHEVDRAERGAGLADRRREARERAGTVVEANADGCAERSGGMHVSYGRSRPRAGHREKLRRMDVTICDVGPRDGLQNEPETLAPAVRAELVSRLARRTGCRASRRSRSCATIACRRWPAPRRSSRQLQRGGAELSGLVLNERGYERFAADGARPRQLHARRDRELQPAQRQRDARRGGRARARRSSRAASVPATVTVSCALGCPFEGEVDPGRRRRPVRAARRRGRARARRHDRRRDAAARAPARRARRDPRQAGRRPPAQHAQHGLRDRPGPRSRAARPCSTRRSAGSAAARSRRTRPAMSRPRISSGSSSATACARASTSMRSSRSRAGSSSCSAAGSKAGSTAQRAGPGVARTDPPQ